MMIFGYWYMSNRQMFHNELSNEDSQSFSYSLTLDHTKPMIIFIALTIF